MEQLGVPDLADTTALESLGRLELRAVGVQPIGDDYAHADHCGRVAAATWARDMDSGITCLSFAETFKADRPNPRAYLGVRRNAMTETRGLCGDDEVSRRPEWGKEIGLEDGFFR